MTDWTGYDAAPAPLFRDPMYDGAADPVVIWNPLTRQWWMFFTARRATTDGPGVGWVHGTDIGIAVSDDGARTWTYRGNARGLQLGSGRDTFWAPEIIEVGGQFHMYVSVIDGVPDRWVGSARICHYTSADLVDWTFRSRLDLGADRVIDACVAAKPNGGFRMWFKNEDAGGHTWSADSDDLYQWQESVPALGHIAHEGPNVFYLGGFHWMIVDEWCGQGVFRSDDLATWTPAGRILATLPGPVVRADDGGPGLHADVVVQDEVGYVFYFTHPDRVDPAENTYAGRRSVIQVANVTVQDGQLRCDRESPHIRLRPPTQRTVA